MHKDSFQLKRRYRSYICMCVCMYQWLIFRSAIATNFHLSLSISLCLLFAFLKKFYLLYFKKRVQEKGEGQRDVPSTFPVPKRSDRPAWGQAEAGSFCHVSGRDCLLLLFQTAHRLVCLWHAGGSGSSFTWSTTMLMWL